MAGFNTKAVHEGQSPEKTTGAVIPPIYQTSTFEQESPAKHKGFEYTRADNPNYKNLEQGLASLEEAKFATVFSSGLGATLASLSLLKMGDHVVAGDDLYGGTYRIFTHWGERFGLKFDFVNTTKAALVEKALRPNTKLIWVETPTNPLLRVSDIRSIVAVAKKKKVPVIVDNTFATSYFQKPLTMGADMVLHSTTKYIGGHSDVIGGVVATNRSDLHDKLKFARKALGVNPSPFDCWLTQRGLKTLGLRMERHQQNAKEIVAFFEKEKKVKKIHYPGFGGMISVEFKLSVVKTKQLISSFKYFTLAESLGGVESLVSHPSSMTHASVPQKERAKIGLSDSLVRFSVGIEDSADLIEDLKSALAKI
ncbi:MAG: aminotransferase class I/II-fold pyridoxal phosphate-dependent enzyme [Deltaproteobacteria bacterium]|nr:aminotransferase class I/II-fold pyridoxal phosphate-dependent enzyme [Deltaproteobacteria bacterium]